MTEENTPEIPKEKILFEKGKKITTVFIVSPEGKKNLIGKIATALVIESEKTIEITEPKEKESPTDQVKRRNAFVTANIERKTLIDGSISKAKERIAEHKKSILEKKEAVLKKREGSGSVKKSK